MGVHPHAGVAGRDGLDARGWGWAAEPVVAIDAVTADGRLVHANAESNSDLYWAARGAGPSRSS